jgi:hypothetical protein
MMSVCSSRVKNCIKKGKARKETDRLCSDDKTRGRDGKAER